MLWNLDLIVSYYRTEELPLYVKLLLQLLQRLDRGACTTHTVHYRHTSPNSSVILGR